MNKPLDPQAYYNSADILEKCGGCGAMFQDEVPENAGFLKNIEERRTKWLREWTAFVRRSNGEPVPEDQQVDYKKRDLTARELRLMSRRIEESKADAAPDTQNFLSDELLRSCENYSIILSQYANSKAPTDLQRHKLSPVPISPSNVENLFSNPFDERNAAPNPLLCTRCFWLQHSNRIANIRPLQQSASDLDSSIFSSQERSFLQARWNSEKSTIVLVVDLTDFPNSLADISDILGEDKNLLLVGNKCDLLPTRSDEELELYKQALRQKAAAIYKKNKISATILVSSKTFEGIEQLRESILNAAKKSLFPNVYLVGYTNAGKSMLWNALLHGQGSLGKATVSTEPGTTLGFLETPLKSISNLDADVSGKLIDSPGLLNRAYLGNFLSFDEIKIMNATKKMKPSTYILSPGRSIFIGGLVRLDYSNATENEDLYVTVVASNMLPIHVTSTADADAVYSKHAAVHPSILYPPIGGVCRMQFFPKLKQSIDFKFSSMKIYKTEMDVNISGVGWMSLSGNVHEGQVSVYSPDGVGISLNSSILQYLVGKGIRGGMSGPKKKYYSNKAQQRGLLYHEARRMQRKERSTTQMMEKRQGGRIKMNKKNME